METRAKKLQDLFATSALTQRMIHTHMQRAFEELNIVPAQLQVLHLIEHQQPVSLKTLANELRLTPGAITQLVDGLVRAGYIERSSSLEDRRVANVALTSTGKDKIAVLKRKKRALLDKIVEDLDDNELEIFLRVQQKMLAYLETNCSKVKK